MLAVPRRLLQRAIVAAVALTALATLAAYALSDGAASRHGVVRDFPDDLFGIAVGPEGELVVTGYHGAVRVSRDSGRSWSRIESGTEDLLRRVAIAPTGAVFAVSSGGRIFRGDLAGGAWTTVHDEAGLYLRDIAFADATSGWVVGHEGLILHTADGGTTWDRQALKNWTGRDKPRLNGIAAIDAQRAVLVGEFGAVAYTRDAGATWTLARTQDLPTLVAVAMHGERGLAVGLNGALVQLELGARGDVAWSRLPGDDRRHLLAVSLADDGRSALVGGRGLLAIVRDGALTPVATSVDATLPFMFVGGVAQGPKGEALAVGQAGLILRAPRLDGSYSTLAAAHPEGSYVLPLNTGSAGGSRDNSATGTSR
jgi:photosystem II stability/assembly factor-like uncharacterized protein